MELNRKTIMSDLYTLIYDSKRLIKLDKDRTALVNNMDEDVTATETDVLDICDTLIEFQKAAVNAMLAQIDANQIKSVSDLQDCAETQAIKVSTLTLLILGRIS